MVFDVFFETEEPRKLALSGTFRNITGQPQRIVFSLNGETFRTITLDNGTGDTEIDIPLPEMNTGRMTLEMDFPDAVNSVLRQYPQIPRHSLRITGDIDNSTWCGFQQ